MLSTSVWKLSVAGARGWVLGSWFELIVSQLGFWEVPEMLAWGWKMGSSQAMLLGDAWAPVGWHHQP